jgi:hypothetical protein
LTAAHVTSGPIWVVRNRLDEISGGSFFFLSGGRFASPRLFFFFFRLPPLVTISPLVGFVVEPPHTGPFDYCTSKTCTTSYSFDFPTQQSQQTPTGRSHSSDPTNLRQDPSVRPTGLVDRTCHALEISPSSNPLNGCFICALST